MVASSTRMRPRAGSSPRVPAHGGDHRARRARARSTRAARTGRRGARASVRHDQHDHAEDAADRARHRRHAERAPGLAAPGHRVAVERGGDADGSPGVDEDRGDRAAVVGRAVDRARNATAATGVMVIVSGNRSAVVVLPLMRAKRPRRAEQGSCEDERQDVRREGRRHPARKAPLGPEPLDEPRGESALQHLHEQQPDREEHAAEATAIRA